jgi:hypothetical protein
MNSLTALLIGTVLGIGGRTMSSRIGWLMVYQGERRWRGSCSCDFRQAQGEHRAWAEQNIGVAAHA